MLLLPFAFVFTMPHLFLGICWFLLGLNFWWVAVTFRSILDIPIRHLDLILPEAKTSILAASSGLCTKRPLTMTTAMSLKTTLG
jgi:hypothetical protein